MDILGQKNDYAKLRGLMRDTKFGSQSGANFEALILQA